MNILNEVEFIGPGHRRKADEIRKGYWTPLLAEWSDVSGFVEKRDLQFFSWDDTGVKVTGAVVNASPIICIPKEKIGHQDLTVSVTGLLGLVASGQTVTSGTETITGFSENYQFNQQVYRREYTTGGETFQYQFTIPAHTDIGKIFRLPYKRAYKITNINVSPRVEEQPLTDLGFYALADNGSRLLYTINWNSVFDNLKKSLYGMFGQPAKCPHCAGSGYINTQSNTCYQCSGLGYSGPNASGFLLDQQGKDYKITWSSGTDSIETYRNKLWAFNWWVTPTKNEIKRYFGHFAQISTGSIELVENWRSEGTTGVESLVTILMPDSLPSAVFEESDRIWTLMADSIPPAGVMINISFLTTGFTGSWDFEDCVSQYRSGFISAVYTGLSVNQQYGFYEPWRKPDIGFRDWYTDWGQDFFFTNYISGGGGYDDACSGLARSGSTYYEGLLEGSAWKKWAWHSGGNADGEVWSTGGSDEGIDQDCFWHSGTYYWDNFWGSGCLTGSNPDSTGIKY